MLQYYDGDADDSTDLHEWNGKNHLHRSSPLLFRTQSTLKQPWRSSLPLILPNGAWPQPYIWDYVVPSPSSSNLVTQFLLSWDLYALQAHYYSLALNLEHTLVQEPKSSYYHLLESNQQCRLPFHSFLQHVPQSDIFCKVSSMHFLFSRVTRHQISHVVLEIRDSSENPIWEMVVPVLLSEFMVIIFHCIPLTDIFAITMLSIWPTVILVGLHDLMNHKNARNFW